MSTENKEQAVCWTIAEWTAAAKIAVPTFYTLPKASRPKSTRIGRRVIIIESASAWLDRMAEQGGVVTTRAAA